jgi:hypothetical protein
MLRLRRSRPRLGQRLLLQRRRVGRSGHAQRISCSSSFKVAEGGNVEEKRVERGGDLPVRPSARALVLADAITHLFHSEAAKL